jgi:prepilin-type N-terminal cleavage/methylation domain-containing protein
MIKKGFTLVELLVVMSILGVLATLVAGGFRSAQMRGRDAQRKSDLKELANALELILSDYGEFPNASGNYIAGCPYSLAGGGACLWGEGELTDGKTVYFKTVPKDPSSSQFYVYRVVPGSNRQKFQLFARLENTQDIDCLADDCLNPPVTYSCGSGSCNFAITSTNTNATE